MLRTLEGKATT
jgi:hypothetical protein